MIGVGFAYLALKNNERFVLSRLQMRLKFQPRKGRTQLASMVEFLNKKKPKGANTLDKSVADIKN